MFAAMDEAKYNKGNVNGFNLQWLSVHLFK